MDFFDQRILAALKDGKPKDFNALLGEVGFSHNTLQMHLRKLTANGLVFREKPAKGLGRPKFTYHLPLRSSKQVTSALDDASVELVAIVFGRLRHVCRFEKGGRCKETRKECSAQFCPQIRK
jgi:predicted ArsR family transcriptional regulator